jgi:hypothetical protein
MSAAIVIRDINTAVAPTMVAGSIVVAARSSGAAESYGAARS